MVLAVTPNVSRRRLVPGDSALDWLVIWRYGGALDAPAVLENAHGEQVELKPKPVGRRAWWDHEYFSAWSVPVGTRAGDWMLRAGDQVCGMIAVETIRETTLADTLVFQAAKGQRISAPDNAVYRNVFFDGFDCVLSSKSAKNVTFIGCSFRNGSLRSGGDHPGLHLIDCKFERFSANMLGDSVCYRCVWSGCPDMPATTVWGDRAVFLDCRWDDTDRGVNFQSVQPINDCLCVDLMFTNVRRSMNGCELLNFEGPHPISRTYISHVDAAGCVGPLLNCWSAPVNGLRLRDAVCERNAVYLAGGMTPETDVTQTGIRLDYCESGGVVVAGPRTELWVDNSAFVRPVRGRGNQRGNAVAPEMYRGGAVVRTTGKATFDRVTFAGLEPGQLATDGVVWAS